jgi:flagellar biosynthesis/type III secretory pathway protein FliH
MADPIKRATETSKKFLEERRTGGPKMLRPGLGPQGKEKKKIQRFPGDFKNFTESKEFKKAKADNLSTYEKAKEHPVERKDAGYKFLMDAGPKEVKAFKEYRKRTAKTRDEAKTQKMAKGGRAGFKSGSKGCKLAMKGKGRAYGKNS